MKDFEFEVWGKCSKQKPHQQVFHWYVPETLISWEAMSRELDKFGNMRQTDRTIKENPKCKACKAQTSLHRENSNILEKKNSCMQRISDWNPRKKRIKCLPVDQTSKEEEECYVPERYPFCTNLRQNYFFQRPSCHHVFFFFFHLVIELTETGIHEPTLNPQTIIKDFLSRPIFCRQILHHLRITAAVINESPSVALLPTNWLHIKP